MAIMLDPRTGQYVQVTPAGQQTPLKMQSAPRGGNPPALNLPTNPEDKYSGNVPAWNEVGSTSNQCPPGMMWAEDLGYCYATPGYGSPELPTFQQFMSSRVNPGTGGHAPLLAGGIDEYQPPADYKWNGNTGSPNPENKYSGGTALWNDMGQMDCPPGAYYDENSGKCIS